MAMDSLKLTSHGARARWPAALRIRHLLTGVVAILLDSPVKPDKKNLDENR